MVVKLEEGAMLMTALLLVVSNGADELAVSDDVGADEDDLETDETFTLQKPNPS